MYHPAIDAMGIFKQGNSTDLVFFQISKSAYKEHGSKIINILDDRFQQRGYTELTENLKSIYAYYRCKAAEVTNIHNMCYVYLSIQTICGGQSNSNYDDLQKDATKKGIQYAILHKDSDLYKQFKYHT